MGGNHEEEANNNGDDDRNASVTFKSDNESHNNSLGASLNKHQSKQVDVESIRAVSLPDRKRLSNGGEDLELLTESQRTSIEDWDDLPESIYSIFFVAKVCSGSFLFAAFVFMFQTSMASLVLVDFIRDLGSDNPLSVPSGVTSIVRAGQGLALTLAVVVQDDMNQAIRTLHSGYDSSVLRLSSSATFVKWLFAYVVQFCVGVIMLTVIFSLIVRSSSVIEIFLNFAALAFITEIDDVAFFLAKHGYIPGKVKDVCDHIQEFKTPPGNKSYLIRRILLLLVILGMFGGWIDIIVKQSRGAYLCKSLLVQFGDDFIGFLPAFSGAYDLRPGMIRDGRVVYTSRGFDGDRLSAFRYCEANRTWIFGAVSGVDRDVVNIDQLCEGENWFLRTPTTETFEISSIPATSWMTRQIGSQGLTFPVSHLFLECNDCGSSTCQGTCMDNVCVCPPELFGDRCELESPCPNVDLDSRTPTFVAVTRDAILLGLEIPTSYDILMTNDGNATSVPVRVQNRPVYFNEDENEAGITVYLMFFNGRRWLIYDSNDIFDPTGASAAPLSQATTASDFAAVFTNETNPFHVFFDVAVDRFIPLFLSSPLDIGTASNAISPAGLSWFARGTQGEQRFDVGRQIGSQFICTVCDDSANACLNQGECFNGLCECFSTAFGTSGALCERVQTCAEIGCQNGGFCNEQTGICTCPIEPGNLFTSLRGNFCQIRSCNLVGSVICVNGGTCLQDSSGCECPLNFFGEACQSFNCTEAGCLNGGECVDDGFRCDCNENFGGIECEIPRCDDLLDGCALGRVCNRQTGVCETPCCDGRPQCETCLGPFFLPGEDPCGCGIFGTCNCPDGSQCRNTCTSKSFCEVNECENGGRCDDELSRCDCSSPFGGDSGFGGDFCETRCCESPSCNPSNCTFGFSQSCTCDDNSSCEICDRTIPFCEIAGCLNGGTCNSTLGQCNCPEGFGGNFCEQRCCESPSCNPSNCTFGFPNRCTCDDDSFCEICDNMVSFCEIAGCENGGVCNPTFGQCDCPEGFTGSGCQNLCCENPQCNATCFDSSGFFCSCANETSSCQRCDASVPVCQFAGCQNGGSCNTTLGACDCPSPFVGSLCEWECCEAGCDTACPPSDIFGEPDPTDPSGQTSCGRCGVSNLPTTFGP